MGKGTPGVFQLKFLNKKNTIMKKFLAFAAFFAATLILSSCGGVENTPEAVAETVLKALYEKDADTMIENMVYTDAFDDVYDLELIRKDKHSSINDTALFFRRTKSTDFRWTSIMRGTPFDPSLIKLVLTEISEDGDKAVAIYVPNEYFTDEVKAKISGLSWSQKWDFTGMRFKLLKNKDGKWKVKYIP